MNRRRMRIAGIVVLLVLLLAGVALADLVGYRVGPAVLGSAGGPMNSAHYALDATLGQSVIGPAASTSLRLYAGYWPATAWVYQLFWPLLTKGTSH